MIPEIYLAFGMGFLIIGVLISQGIKRGAFDIQIKVQHKHRGRKK